MLKIRFIEGQLEADGVYRHPSRLPNGINDTFRTGVSTGSDDRLFRTATLWVTRQHSFTKTSYALIREIGHVFIYLLRLPWSWHEPLHRLFAVKKEEIFGNYLREVKHG